MSEAALCAASCGTQIRHPNGVRAIGKSYRKEGQVLGEFLACPSHLRDRGLGSRHRCGRHTTRRRDTTTNGYYHERTPNPANTHKNGGAQGTDPLSHPQEADLSAAKRYQSYFAWWSERRKRGDLPHLASAKRHRNEKDAHLRAYPQKARSGSGSGRHSRQTCLTRLLFR